MPNVIFYHVPSIHREQLRHDLTTVHTVVHHEAYILGAELLVHDVNFELVKRRPSDECLWVYPTWEQAAAELAAYQKDLRASDDPDIDETLIGQLGVEWYAVPDGYLIVAEDVDSNGRLLIWAPIFKTTAAAVLITLDFSEDGFVDIRDHDGQVIRHFTSDALFQQGSLSLSALINNVIEFYELGADVLSDRYRRK